MMKVIIAGHLGADVETRYTEKGKKVSTLRVAANTKRSGKEETVWWRVSLWGDEFDAILPYLKKGSGVIVTGDFVRNEIYMDRDGKPQMSLEISARSVEFNPFGRSDKAGQDQAAPGQKQASPYAQTTTPASPPSYAASKYHPNDAPRGQEEYGAPPPSYTPSSSQSSPSKDEYTPHTEQVPF